MPASALLDLAHTRFSLLSGSETALFRAVEGGEEVRYDPSLPEPARTVRADRIAWLCNDPRAHGYVAPEVGLSVRGALVVGALRVRYTRVPFPIACRECVFEDSLDVSGAHLESLTLDGSSLKRGVCAEGLHVAGFVSCKEVKVEGETRFTGTTIDGQWDCEGGTFKNPDDCAINANRIKVGGSVFFRKRFVAEGRVRLFGAVIGGGLDCSGGTFKNPTGDAISAARVKVGNSVFFRNGFVAEGKVRLFGATVGGQWSCAEGTFKNPGDVAIYASRVKVANGTFFSRTFSVDGEVLLRVARLGSLLYDPDSPVPCGSLLDLRGSHIEHLMFGVSVPEYINIDGCTYERITGPKHGEKEVHELLTLLRRRPPEPFLSQPYSQCARVLRAHGRESDTRAVLIEREHDRSRYAYLPVSERLWLRVTGALMAYGYKPLNVLGWMSLMVACGWFVFGTWSYTLVPTRDADAFTPTFSPLAYSLDTFLPIIDLHHAEYWIPDPAHTRVLRDGVGPITEGALVRLYYWAHMALGWFLGALFVAGVTGMVRQGLDD